MVYSSKGYGHYFRRKRIRMRDSLTYSLFALVLLMISPLAYAQNSCGQKTLDNAQFSYNVGRFGQVEEVLKNCLVIGAFDKAEDFAQKEDAIRLLAMNSIAMDSLKQAKQYVEQLVEHNPHYTERSKDPLLLTKQIEAYKDQDFGTRVISASKFEEKLEEAPAPMLVITAEDIRNRGYLDLEQVFHDIPGFSVSRGNGPGYSTVYPRGYRSTTNDRFLLLIDGIEENDLNSDNAVINRQTPLTNIKQIEVIYGPASTMYGANAYAAVINIITKGKVDLFPNDNSFTGSVQANYGSWNTRFVDANLNKKFKGGYFSLTTRLFQSDEMDLTNNGYNYKEKTTEELLSGATVLKDSLASDFYKKQLNSSSNSYFNYSIVGSDTTLSLSNAGANQMRTLDKGFYDNYDGFNNSVNSWYVYGKLKFKNSTVGIESYRNDKGAAPWYPSHEIISSDKLSRWITWNTFIYYRFKKQISTKLNFTNSTSYRLHTIDGNSNLSNVNSYSNGLLNFESLVLNKAPSVSSLYLFRSSNQFRNEAKLFYEANQKLNIITGVEFRSGIIQGAYLTSSIPKPNEHSSIPDSASWTPGGIVNNTYDFGGYSQIRYRFTKAFTGVFGGRLDYNQIRTTEGYGLVFNPRIALIYSKEKYVLKVIHSEAFKDASSLQKFSVDPTTGRNATNPRLQPEKVKNIELSAFYKITKSLNVDVTGYFARYTNVVGIGEVQVDTGFTRQYQPIGELNIYGLQASIHLKMKNFTAWINYSYTHPENRELRDENNAIKLDSNPRVSDIPAHVFNVVLNYSFLKDFNLNVRSNYVGERKTGRITSPSKNPATVFPDYFIAHANLNYNIYEGFTVGLLVNNIFDKQYNDPGIRDADGILESYSFPQNTRSFMLRANYNF